MKKIIICSIALSLVFSSCKKEETAAVDFEALKTNIINDFVSKIALAKYLDLKNKGIALNTAIVTLNTTTTDANLLAARNAWKDARSTWEQTEAFLFGPVDENEYDPETDTWPVNYNDMNALLADNSHPLDLSDIEGLTSRALKGYHPLEYILWGQNGSTTAASLTARQKTYMVSLSEHIKIQVEALYESWVSTGGNYAAKVLTAGNGSSVFSTKQDLFTTITAGLIGICEEVGEGKMKEPFDAAITDPAEGAKIVESPFSGNSLIDFKNNITGAYNVYLGKGNEDGHGLNEIVRAKNISLDNKIQQKFIAAIGSFDNITVPFEQAISTQTIQCTNTMNAINDLAEILEDELAPFIIQYITD